MANHYCTGSPCHICFPGATGALDASRPLQFVMAPNPKAWEQAASVICGHDFVQQWLPDEQAEFESFVREVLRSFGPVSSQKDPQ
jgi:hypothetical protein